jgi:hypothetical protein
MWNTHIVIHRIGLGLGCEWNETRCGLENIDLIPAKMLNNGALSRLQISTLGGREIQLCVKK